MKMLTTAMLGVVLLSGCTSTKQKIRAEIEPLTQRVDGLVRKLDMLEAKVAKRAAPGKAREAHATAATEKTPATKASIPQEEPAERLYGTWISEEVPTKVGPTVNTVTFRRDGTVKIDTRSTLPLIGHLRTTEGPFEVHGDVVSSETIEGGTAVQFSFDGDALILKTKTDKVIRLHPAA